MNVKAVPSIQSKHDKQVAIWLIFVAAIIFFMIVLGGVTRLTHSGLSMVEWKPLVGTIPPLSDADWQTTFEKYKEYPEYQKKNLGMSLVSFKSIFYFEYFHRILGRLIGLLFIVPFLVFWFRGAIRKSMVPQMITLFVLGGFQGLLGWYMVKSGLVDNPQVSQYRLSAHLLSAVIIYGYILWVAFGLLKRSPEQAVNREVAKIYRYTLTLGALVLFMIATGGFVAGTKAGLAYNTFPLMNGQFIPDGMYRLEPFWLNWFENITAIQFNHRMIAYLLIILVPLIALKVIQLGVSKKSKTAAQLLLLVLFIQVSLGIATLLLKVPVTLAASHQAGAVVLLSVVIFIMRELGPSIKNQETEKSFHQL